MSSWQDDPRTASDVVPLSDGLIDRLVDGELDEATRTAVLVRLETEPGGWRRCALAFLEAQAWREAVAVIAHAEAPDPNSGDGLVRTEAVDDWRPRSAPARRRLWPLAIAAAVVAAFSAGWLASNASRAGAGIPDSPRVLAGSQPPGPPVETEAAPTGDLDRPAFEDLPGFPATPASLAQLEDSAGEAEAYLNLPGALRRQLEERGYRVEHHRGLMSMDLNNGRSVEVPVDEVQVRYVGNPVY